MSIMKGELFVENTVEIVSKFGNHLNLNGENRY